MMAEPVLFAVQFVYPRIQLVFDLPLRPVAQFPLGPVAVAVFPAFKKIKKGVTDLLVFDEMAKCW